MDAELLDEAVDLARRDPVHVGLHHDRDDRLAEGDEVLERAKADLESLKAFAVWVFHKAAKNLPEPPDEDAAINPLAIGLQPERWEEDGLFSGDGITLAEALERLPGIEEMDLEARGAVATA